MIPEASPSFNVTDKIATVWCRLTHRSAMWPIHGRYHCRTCMRQFPVPWEEASKAARPTSFPAGLRSSLKLAYRVAQRS